MNLRKTIAAAVTGLALSAAAVVTPASADTTSTTITLTGGSLSIDAPSTASGSASVEPGTTMTVNLTDTTVVDNRGSLLGWTVTGSSTDFTKDATYSMPKAGFTWATGTVASSNGSLTGVAAGAGGSMGASFAVATAIAGAGAGTFTYPATVTGLVPVNMKAGDYVATITQSIL